MAVIYAMKMSQIQKKAKVVNNARGRPVEVILPYKDYLEMPDLAVSMEIYQQEDTQQSIARAREDVKRGKTASFKKADEVIAWLKGK
jgi:hypothetical protein